MKRFLLFFLLCVPFLVAAQTVDSAAIRQVDSLIQISRDLTGKRDYDKALEVNAAAEKLATEKLGRESAAYGSACFNHGRILHLLKGDLPEAEKWYIESKTIREKALSKEHPDYAWSLNNLAILYKAMGNYEKAEPLYLESKAIREKALGKEHPDYAASLNNLAVLYYSIGDYEKAEALHLEAKDIREKVLGKEHLDFALSLSNLAILYVDMGNYEKAETLHLESKTIREKVLGKEHSDYVASIHNLGILYKYMGNYENAEPLFLEAKSLWEKVRGKEHPNYASSLNNLAALYREMGNYEKAEPLYLEAQAIREKVLGKERPDYAWSLNNLAILYKEIGNYEKAESLHFEAKAIREKMLGKEHPDYAHSLNDMAVLYMDMKNYRKAESLYLEALSIRENSLGKEHLLYAQSLYDLSKLYVVMNNFEKAESLGLQAKANWEKTLGKEHPSYAESLNGLADLYEKQSKFSASEPLLTEAAALEQARLSGAAAFLSERELAKYATNFQKTGENLGTYLLARRSAPSATLSALAFDHALFHKGFLLTAAARLNALSADSPESAEINNRLKSYRRRLAAEYPKSIEERKEVAELEERANAAEKELSRSVAGYADAIRQVKWQEVQSSLKKEEAAIEFVHFNINFPKKKDSTMYAALLLRPGNEQPVFIPLFEEKQLTAVLTPDNKEQRSELLAQIYSRGAQPLQTSQLAGLNELIWQPLNPLLKKVKTVYFSPSGLLHRINFDAIPTGKKETLADRFRLVRLGSTRSLVVPDLTKTDTNDAALFGGIQYEIDTTALVQDSAVQDLLAARSEGLSFTYADRNIPQRGDNWSYLPGTAQEVSDIQSLLKKSKFSPQVFSGENATEESFKTIGTGGASPRILHLAMHGFFFPDPKSAVSGERVSDGSEPVFKTSDHPMIRSGLILAGGNHAWQTGKPLRPDMDDGILTAYEISQMNLSNTELVVLSACETGLGDIEGNEGVYGLQRAFKIAGAKYLVMSLWQVPDFQTQELMTTFYSKWLEEKMTIPDAFRSAQQEMREKYQNPYFWAGFVLVE